MLYVVDVQYYQLRHQKVLKEATCMPLMLRSLHVKHYTFKAPFPLHTLSVGELKTVNYTHHKLGVLHWCEGENTISDFVASIPAASILLCSGLEKSLLLQSLLPLSQIVNVNIALNNLTATMSNHHHHHHHTPVISCPYHHHHKLCSLTRMCQLFEYLMSVGA